MEEAGATIAVVEPEASGQRCPPEEEAVAAALGKRPDYRGIAKKKAIAEDRIRAAIGGWFPDVYGSGQYVKRAGDGTSFQEDWSVGLEIDHPGL